MATLSQIKSPVWTYSIHGGGAIAEGLAAIRQCILVIIRTTKGTDPLRPEFGSDVFKYHDAPMTVAIPNIKKAILEAIEIWEKRVRITYLRHLIVSSNLQIEVGFTLADSDIADSILISIGNGGIDSGTDRKRLVLQGYFPPNPKGYQYLLFCELDNTELLPAPPENGFGEPLDIFNWVVENWGSYGQWYLTADSIVGYMNPDYTSGTLTISLSKKLKFSGLIPVNPIGNKYEVSISVDGTVYDTSTGLYTYQDVLAWAQETLGELGPWDIESMAGAFDEGFDDGFLIYQIALIVYTDQADSVIINISTIPE